MVPTATAILHLVVRIRDMGLIATYRGVVLPQVAITFGEGFRIS